MNGEIFNNETKEIKNPSVENYKSIKPENDMSPVEVSDYWKSEFQEVAQPKQYYDDNGKIYREGDRLVANNEYEVNGYKYTTDAQPYYVSAGKTTNA